jgi:hypothetical protein
VRSRPRAAPVRGRAIFTVDLPVWVPSNSFMQAREHRTDQR